jgi:AcrR family transcriptional regulator
MYTSRTMSDSNSDRITAASSPRDHRPPAIGSRPGPGPRSRRPDGRSRAARAGRRDAREELLDAALALCAQHGYAQASVDAIVERAGYSKGAFYWHFSGKSELFRVLYEERVDRPWRETIALLESSSPALDMAEEANRRFAQLIEGRPEVTLVAHEYWMQAVRDDDLRKSFAERHRSLRAALGKAIISRLEHLGAPPLSIEPEMMASAFLAIAVGLAQQKLTDPDSVPGDLFGRLLALIYAGHVACATTGE